MILIPVTLFTTIFLFLAIFLSSRSICPIIFKRNKNSNDIFKIVLWILFIIFCIFCAYSAKISYEKTVYSLGQKSQSVTRQYVDVVE